MVIVTKVRLVVKSFRVICNASFIIWRTTASGTARQTSSIKYQANLIIKCSEYTIKEKTI